MRKILKFLIIIVFCTVIAILMHNNLYRSSRGDLRNEDFNTADILDTRLQQLFPQSTKITLIFQELEEVGYNCKKFNDFKNNKRLQNYICKYDRLISYPVFHHYDVIIEADNQDKLLKFIVKEIRDKN
ncbi:hypothetical protein NOVO_02145 [Rickettsiales bacterium Ac37b]|nr:hypothetical protein NOVO_02145 [Rickettsiales bacterium Ac37b]